MEYLINQNEEEAIKKKTLKPIVQLGIVLIFTSISSLILMLLGKIIDIGDSRIILPLLAFPINILAITFIFPKKIKIPFGEIGAKEFSRNIGLYKPDNLLKNILLGIILGICSLLGMLIGSILTGRYQFNLEQLELEQLIFATTPGIWEEVIYRGILMFVLFQMIKDVKKAAIIQSIIFGIVHFQSFDVWSMVNIISVIFIGFGLTYVAYKTNSLIPSIIFHFLHDGFIFLVQTPDRSYYGTYENIVFFISLWVMIGVGCLITKISVEKGNIAQTKILYDLSKVR